MKRLSNIKKSIVKNIFTATMCFSLLVAGVMPKAYVHATDMTSTMEAAGTSVSTEETNTDANGTLGTNSDVGIEVTKSITGKAGKKVKISFKLKSNDAEKIRLKSVYPVIDSSFLFETSGDAYKIVSADSAKKQKTLSASFKLKARSDVQEGYQGVRFIGEYEKTEDDGTIKDYYIIKTINIYFEGEESESDSEDEEEDDESDVGDDEPEEEAVAPKLIITGYKTEPEKIMAGQTFKLTIHVQNTSKTTSVCNGKFLIGNEAGAFLPTSGSSAVFVESIPAGKTGDIEIEMKAGADLAQKNYILVVKGDFDDGKGNNFTSSDNLTVPVYQEVKFDIAEVTLTPEVLGIGSEGTLMFTLNNRSGVDVYNVNVKAKDDAVTSETSYVGNVTGSSSAYATLYLNGVQDNSDTGSITIEISYEDAEGNIGTIEKTVQCQVSEDGGSLDEFEDMDGMELEDEYYEEEEDYEEGLPFYVYIIIAIVVIVIVITLIVFLVRRKKKRMTQLLEEVDGEDDLDDENF